MGVGASADARSGLADTSRFAPVVAGFGIVVAHRAHNACSHMDKSLILTVKPALHS